EPACSDLPPSESRRVCPGPSQRKADQSDRPVRSAARVRNGHTFPPGRYRPCEGGEYPLLLSRHTWQRIGRRTKCPQMGPRRMTPRTETRTSTDSFRPAHFDRGQTQAGCLATFDTVYAWCQPYCLDAVAVAPALAISPPAAE